jgi:energy-coupling factor transport system permease protein
VTPASRTAAPAYHTRTWLVWVATAALAAGLIRNPLYLVVVLLAARVVDAAQAAAHAPDGAPDPRRQGWGTFLRVGLVIAVASALFNFLAAHVGTHVLVRLPGDWPLVGGPLTLEGLVYGLLNGLVLITLIAVFGTFSSAVDNYTLLRGIPAGFAQAGLVTAIALAYVPQTLTRLREIQEAQLLRGHRVRGARGLLPLAVPLLTGGLDRAINLAEAMEARGFSPERLPADARGQAAPTGSRPTRLLPLGLVAGAALVLLGGFFSAYLQQQPAWGWALVGGGGLLVTASIVGLSRRTTRTRYRREIWRRQDTIVSAVLVAAGVALLAVALTTSGAWNYTPYPTLTWPPFDPLLGIITLALAAPAGPLLAQSNKESSVTSGP